MPIDIRDKFSIRHEDVVGLNFISPSTPFFFRRHFRQGLRSHIMELLPRAAVALEDTGVVVEGVRRFPRARPAYMLRLFRTRLPDLESALAEIDRVTQVARYLGPDFIAASSEFIADYHGPSGSDILLCGLQEYVPGEILDPWSLLDAERLLNVLYESLHPRRGLRAARRDWIAGVRGRAAGFVLAVKRMAAEIGLVPDLSGVGNLVVPENGTIRLVDINNVSRISFGEAIPLDDKGYPVCDKSVEALSLIEAKVLGRSPDLGEDLYRFFLDPDRKRRVAAREADFSPRAPG